MATKTFEELKQLAIQIRDEKTNKQNTATRIGTQMLEHLNKLEQDYYDKTATDEELKQRDEKLTELSSEKVESYLFSKEKFSNPINGLIAVSILDLSIFYKKGYNGEKWCFDSHGIKEDGTIVLTLYNLTTKGRIEFQKNIESIEHTCLLFNYNSEDYDINFIFNPYNYLNLIPEAKSQQASGWKRLYTERKTEEYSFSESVFTDYIHDKFDTVKKEELDNATKKIEETQNEIDNINSLSLYAKPGTVEFKNEDLEFSELDRSTFNNYTYYCNETLVKDGFLKSIKVVSDGATSIDVITAKVIENNGNLDLILIKNYGNFSIKSEGESTVFINETQILNHKGDCVFVKFNGGNLKYKSPYYGTGYSFTSSAIQKITVRVGCTTNWIEPIYRNFINSNFGDIMTSLYGHKDTGILFTNEELDLSLYDKTSTNYNYYCNLPLKRAGKLKTILLKSDMSIQAKIGLCISGTFVCLKNYGTLTSEGGKINIDDDTVYPSGSLLFIKPLSQYYYNWAYTGFELQSDYIKPSTVNIAYTSKWEYVEYIYENIKDKIDLFIEKQNEINLSVQDYDKEEYIEVFSDYFIEKKSDWIDTNSVWVFDTENSCVKTSQIGTITTNVLKLNRVYHSDKRILRFSVNLNSSIRLGIGSTRYDKNDGEGESFWEIDCVNMKLKMYKVNSNRLGVNLSDVAAQKDIPFTINGNYIVEVEKNDITYTLRLYDYTSGESVELKLVGWDSGRLLQYHTFVLLEGDAIKISSLSVSMLNNPNVVYVGDSIIEGVGMYSTDNNTPENLYNRYAELSRIKAKKSIISAAGGDNIDTIIKKFDTEYNIIKPKNMFMSIGTNGGISVNTESKFKLVIDKCVAINCTPIINMITAGKKGAYIDINRMILSLAEDPTYKNKFKYCRLDLATSVDNYPWVDDDHPTTDSEYTTRVDKSKMVDGTHPNYEGSIACYNRTFIDVPGIYPR